MKDSGRPVSVAELFVVLLSVGFIMLRVCDVIDWPWYLLISPFLVYLAVVLVELAVLVIVYLVKRR